MPLPGTCDADFMMGRPAEWGELVEVLEEFRVVRSPIHALSLPSRHVLPKVRAFMELTAAALGRNGAER